MDISSLVPILIIGNLCLNFFFITPGLISKHLIIESAKSSACINSLNGLPVPNSFTLFF